MHIFYIFLSLSIYLIFNLIRINHSRPKSFSPFDWIYLQLSQTTIRTTTESTNLGINFAYFYPT